MYPQEEASAGLIDQSCRGVKGTALVPVAQASFVQANATQSGLLCVWALLCFPSLVSVHT